MNLRLKIVIARLRATSAHKGMPKASGKGRALCMELMIPNPAIRNLIREDKIHQIYSVMQTGQGSSGMQTFNQSLAHLYLKKQISLQTALARSSLPDELQEMINRGAATVTAQSTGQGRVPTGARPGG